VNNRRGKKHAKDKDSELGFGAQKKTRGQPVKKLSVVINVIPPDDLPNESRYKIQNPQITDALPGKTSQYAIF
jgi:hypothetical protein